MSALDSLTGIVAAAAAAARRLEPSVVEVKAAQDYVTDVDRRLQADIIAAVAVAFPGVPAVGEEDIGEQDHLPDRAFLIDPLDGTANWIARLPFSAVSVAYVEKGETLLAAVAGIRSDDVYRAEAGRGAWRNDRRLVVRPGNELIALSTGVLDAIAGGGDTFRALRRFGKIRNLGSQALQLCAVAQGSLLFDASLEARLWDDAAGRLIATEAGARYSAAVGAEDSIRPAARQRSLCAHPDVYESVEAILRSVLATT